MNPDVLRMGPWQLAESPLWHGGTESLLWVDIASGLLLDSAWESTEVHSVAYETTLGFVAESDGGLVLGLGDTIWLADRDGRLAHEIARIALPDPRMRLNDGKCDPHGRLLVGSMDPQKTGELAALYSVEGDGRARVIRDRFTISNGIGWSPDGATIYYTDSFQHTVFAAEYSSAGITSNERVFVEHSAGQPDGLAVDEDGGVWVASYGGGAVVRFDEAGRPTDEIRMPVSRVSSVAFAGPQLRTLVITTARVGLPGTAVEEQAGAVFACTPGVAGVPVASFRI